MTEQNPEKGSKKLMAPTMDDFPESVLVHILSFLPTTTAIIRTAGVARRWRYLWRIIPDLHLDMREFRSRYPDRPLAFVRERFAQMIDEMLPKLCREVTLNRFYLVFDYKNLPQINSSLDSWIDHALLRKVKEIKIHLSQERFDGERYCLDLSRLSNRPVELLQLYRCDISMPTSPIPFPFLKAFRLLGGFPGGIYLTDEVVKNLMLACVKLETLSMDAVGFQSLKIESTTLKELELEIEGDIDKDTAKCSIEICAPRLQSIRFFNCKMGKYILSDISSLSEVQVNFEPEDDGLDSLVFWSHLVRLFSGVERLTIQNMWKYKFQNREEFMDGNPEKDEESVHSQEELHGKLTIAKGVFSPTFVLSNLKHLELLTGYTKDDLLGIELLLGTCPLLESMVLQFNLEDDDNLADEIGRPIILHIPCLRTVRMKNYRGARSEIYVVELLKRAGVVLQNIVAFSANVDGISSPSFVLWSKIQKSSNMLTE